MTVDLSRAALLIDRGSWTEARSLAEAALAEDPHRGDALRLLAAAAAGEGRLDDADRILAAAVAGDPGAAATIDELIRISHLRGDFRRLGEALLARLRVSPERADLWNDLGAVEERLGNPAGAATTYRRAIAVEPALGPALLNAANLVYREGAIASAALLALSAAASTASPSAWTTAGHAQQRLGRAMPAERSYRRSLAMDPEQAPAWEGLATLRRETKDHERVLLFLLRAMARWRLSPGALANLSEAYRGYGQHHLAIRSARRSLGLAPDLGLGANALALGHGEVAEDNKATTWARRAHQLDPENGALMINLGIMLKAEGHLRQAQDMLRAGLARRPNDSNGHLALATALLADGQVREGFSEYEWRHAPSGTLYDLLPAPRWDGRPLARGTLLVWGEQGIGDEISFIQLLRLLQLQVRRLVVECDPRLLTVFKRSFRGVEFVGRSSPPAPRLFDRTIDAQIAMLSIPDAMGLDKSDLRSRGPYLQADSERTAVFRRTLEALGDRPRIGISWRSLRKTPVSSRIHPDLAEWRPILGIPGVTFVNLQYGDVQDDVLMAKQQFGADIRTVPDLDLFDDLEGVLALSAGLDLVISSGTSAYCLAAAYGIETWQLQWRLAYTAFGDDAHCVWPRARGFVREPGESWSRPITEAASALKTWLRDRRGG
jgi:tetratricopeptide (TPR) repeat protein